MIIGMMHRGSGLGNQLHRYVMTRVLAMDKGLEWGIACPGNFKGHTLFTLDMGQDIEFPLQIEMPAGKVVIDSDWPLFQEDYSKGYDWKGINAIQDNTIVDGEFQGEHYFEHHKERIDRWLETEPIDLGENVCILNFRGGEYKAVPDLYLTHEYWALAIQRMLEVNPNMIFRVVTDDVAEAQKFFPYFEVQHDVAKDWRSVRHAHYLILSNSSFGILPAWLNDKAKKIIAPKYWAGRNVKIQRLPYNVYTRFEHI